jgi:pimeloyl-ACP methyl ester carboxylesterase
MPLPKYQDRYVKVDGKNVRYWVAGEGPAVILVHGLACSAEFWQYNVADFAQEYRVYALDLIGFGRSDKNVDEFTLAYGASFIAGFMDTLGIERAALVGNSLGGAICAQFSVQYPRRLDKLILVDSAGLGRELQFFLRLWSVPILGGMIFGPYQRTFRLLAKLVFYDWSAVDEEWLADAAAVLSLPGVRENALATARIGVDLRGQREELFRGLHGQLSRMTVPTLIIWGSHDLAVPVSHAYTAQDLIPNSRVRIMERCGHIPQMERPQEFNRLVLDFLGGGS